jgi:hypothetical protein
MTMAKQKLWSANSLCVELRVNARTLAKALADIQPDGRISGRDAWHLATAIEALRQYEATSDRLNGRRLNGSAGAVPDPAFARLERLAVEIDSGMARMRDAPADQRVKVLEGFGSAVGEFDRVAGGLGPFRDLILREIVTEITGLLNAEGQGQTVPHPEA